METTNNIDVSSLLGKHVPSKNITNKPQPVVSPSKTNPTFSEGGLFGAIKEETNTAYTANGSPAYKSTGDELLNLFNSGASFRGKTGSVDFKETILKAWHEHNLYCMKMLFYFRDIRGGDVGQGERDMFRDAYKILLTEFEHGDNSILLNNLVHIPEYGRFDDLIYLYGTTKESDTVIKDILVKTLNADIKNVSANKGISLLGKWLPSENTSSKTTVAKAKIIRREVFGLSSTVYRKTLSVLRKYTNIIENHLRLKDYASIDYSKVPSKANMKYRNAFKKNDTERYNDFISKVNKGEVKMNMSTTYPHEIVSQYIDNKHWGVVAKSIDQSLEAAWKSMPKMDIKGNFLVLADHSGSMTCSLNGANNIACMDVSTAMAIYIAENNKEGIFHNKFISFSTNPHLVDLAPYSSLHSKIQHVRKHDSLTTNLDAVFNLILDTAIAHDLPKEDMPDAIIIVSDMEFDRQSSAFVGYSSDTTTTIKRIKAKYQRTNYTMPKIIFWNCAQKVNHHAANKNEGDVMLLNGYKPGMFETMLLGANPLHFMEMVLQHERYANIV